MEDKPTLVSLDEISDSESQSDNEVDILSKTQKTDKENGEAILLEDKVDALIGRMDRFFDCFSTMQKGTKKYQNVQIRS